MMSLKTGYKTTKFLILLVLMLVIIIAISEKNKLSFLSETAMTNYPITITGGVNIVNGITTINGKPFFPFGFYHVSW